MDIDIEDFKINGLEFEVTFNLNSLEPKRDLIFFLGNRSNHNLKFKRCTNYKLQMLKLSWNDSP
jgi:hypothetical protein